MICLCSGGVRWRPLASDGVRWRPMASEGVGVSGRRRFTRHSPRLLPPSPGVFFFLLSVSSRSPFVGGRRRKHARTLPPRLDELRRFLMGGNCPCVCASVLSHVLRCLDLFLTFYFRCLTDQRKTQESQFSSALLPPPSIFCREPVSSTQLAPPPLDGIDRPHPRLTRRGEARPGAARPDPARRGPTRRGEARPGAARPGAGRRGPTRRGEARLGEARPDPARRGPARRGEARPGAARPGAGRPRLQPGRQRGFRR